MTRNTRKDSELTLANHDLWQLEDPWSSFPRQGIDLDHSLGESVWLCSAAGHHTYRTMFLWTTRMLLLSYFWGQVEGRYIVSTLLRCQFTAACEAATSIRGHAQWVCNPLAKYNDISAMDCVAVNPSYFWIVLHLSIEQTTVSWELAQAVWPI